jgi:hypothetical protein
MADLTDMDPASGAVWDALLDLSARQPRGWTLVGAQMVILLGHESGRVLPRATADADLVVDVRSVRGGTAQLSSLLVDIGFELEGVDAFGVGHRFGKGDARIDVLAPDGLPKSNKRLTTTIPPAHTVSVPGGTQALHRTRLVDIQRDQRVGQVPCPDLLGAILVKARAVDVADLPEAQLSDLAFLFGLVEDPRRLSTDLQGNERNWLKRRAELLNRDHPAWRSVPEDAVSDAYIAMRILSGH